MGTGKARKAIVIVLGFLAVGVTGVLALMVSRLLTERWCLKQLEVNPIVGDNENVMKAIQTLAAMGSTEGLERILAAQARICPEAVGGEPRDLASSDESRQNKFFGSALYLMREAWGTEGFVRHLSKIARGKRFSVGGRALALRVLPWMEEGGDFEWLSGTSESQTGRWQADMVPVLVECLEDPHAMMRQNAAMALAEYKARPVDAARSLERLLGDADPAVKKAAAEAMKLLEAE